MKIVELSLLKGRLIENGIIDAQGEKLSKGSNKIIVTLHNVGIPNVSLVSSRDAEFRDGQEYVFLSEYDEDPYLTKIFRANTYEEFYIEIEVTSVTKPTKAAKILYKLLKGVSESVIDLIPGGDIVTSATKVAGNSLFELIKPEDNVQVIGRGVVRVGTDNLPEEVSIPLIVPKKVQMTKVSYDQRIGQQKRKDKAIRKFQTKELEKGEENGFIQIGFREVD